MTAKSSSCEDPVDLGPFLQNYVMKNPFRVQPSSSADGEPRAGPGRWTVPRLRARRRVDKTSTTLNGTVDDDEDDDVCSQTADVLLHSAETSSDEDIKAW